MGLEFLDRTLRTFSILLLIFLPFGTYYLGFEKTLSVFSGGIWGLLNIIFISAMVRAIVRPEGPDKKKAISLGLFKFPVLYLSGYFLLKTEYFDPMYLVIGFTSLFGVIILKALGLMLTNADDSKQENHLNGVA